MADPPAALCASLPPDSAFLSALLSSLAEKHQVCGAQLAIRRHDETVAIEVGELENRGGRSVTRDAAFPVGSITKAFTATLAMVLVADGDLDLDEPVGEHLPELGDLGELLTVRQLLSHTSGLACGPDSPDGPAAESPRRYVAEHCRRQNLVLQPGAGFSYSNLGYVLVGRLIEAITGMSWPEAMESILLRPLGIEPAFVTGDAPARPLATGHSVNLALNRTQPVRQQLAPAEAPTGALALSATDLVALGRLHLPPGLPGLLPSRWAEVMRQAVPTADPFGLADGWGLGLALFRAANDGAANDGAAKDGASNRWAGHDGNADGTACYLRIDPVGGWIIALTANTGTGIGLWQDLLARLSGAGIPAAGDGGQNQTAPEPSAALAPPDYAGAYANGDLEYLVTGTAGRLYFSVDGAELVMLASPEAPTFALLDPASGQRLPGGRFERDPITGEINGIQVNGRLARRREYAVVATG